MDGWVKLHRKLIDSRVFANEGLLKVWIWCLIRANHEQDWVPIKTGKGVTEVGVNPGEFIFGRKTAAKELRMKESTLWKRMQKLENAQNLNIQSNSHYSIVSIINWASYQQCVNNKGTGKGTGKEQPRNTDKNVKNIYSDKLTAFVGNFISYIKETKPKQSPKTKNLEQNSLDEIDKLIRLDGFDIEYIRKVIGWAVKDDFWGDQIFSLAGLRKKSKNKLTKFQNLSAAYDREHKEPEQVERVPVFRVVNDD